jgi:hypothetical protein
MKSRWVTHNFKRVFIADFSNYASDAVAIRAECEAIKVEFGREKPGSVRSITNAEGMSYNADNVKVLSELLSYSNKYVFQRAVVGAGGFRKYFLETFAKLTGNASFMAFETLEQALDWIAQD